MANYSIISHNGTGKYLNVYGSGTINARRNVVIWDNSGSNDQKWVIDSLTGQQTVRSVNNPVYGLNALRTTWNCDVIPIAGNTDAKVTFVLVSSGIYRIRLVSDTSKYLTADGTASGSSVSWKALNSSASNQKWKLVAIGGSTGGDTGGNTGSGNGGTTGSQTGNSRTLGMPSGPRCNWSQKHSGVTNHFGTGACTLVSGLDCANFYATNGVGYTPNDMRGETYWKNGFTRNIPGPGVIGGKVEGSKAYLLSQIKSEIDAGRPVIINIGPAEDKNHTVFAYGYTNNAQDFADIKVYDPANLDTTDIAGRDVTLYNAMDYNHDYFNIRSLRLTYRG